jgi:small conductance mechanosensitive channel
MLNLGNAFNLLSRKFLGWWKSAVLLLPNFFLAILLVVVFWFLARSVRNLLIRLLRRVSHSEQVNQLLGQALFLAVMAGGTFIALGILGLQKTVASLLAGAGILGLALGFAFQYIAANLMAGIYLSVERPFRRGQLVKVQDYFGVVQDVTLRWTELLTQQGQLVYIPNKKVFENPFMNYSSRGHRRIDLTVGVSYGDDLETVRKLAIETLEEVPDRDPDKPVELFYEELAESAITFSVRFWTKFNSQKDYLRARSDAIIRLKKAFDANGITMPFPTRTIDFGVKGGLTLAQSLAEARGTRETEEQRRSAAAAPSAQEASGRRSRSF